MTSPPRAPATEVPFSCNPLPAAFFFPAVKDDTPGIYGRYASYDVGAASAVAVSPDGLLAALATGDGVVRLIDVGASRVVAVVTHPRASLDLVAFSGSGEALLTVARGAREATLWEVATARPVWTATLPGHRHDNATPDQTGFTPGGISFSPDGASVVVSPGRGLFRLDVGSGELRASWTNAVISDLGHDWEGRRLLVTEPSLAAHCIHRPNGGTVVRRDAATLAPVATLANYGEYPMVRGQPAFRVSPASDYVLTPGTFEVPSPQAFRPSDGAMLPPPPFGTFPLAFMPAAADLERVLVAEEGELRLRRLSDGEILARTAGTAAAPIAISRDGRTILLGGTGPELLRVWNPDYGVAHTVCSTQPGWSSSVAGAGTATLSATGDLLAMSRESDVQLIRAADGTLLRTFRAARGAPLRLSPDGRYLVGPAAPPIAGPAPPDLLLPRPAPTVFRTEDGSVAGRLGPSGHFWTTPVFAPDSSAAYATFFESGKYQLWILDLTSGGPDAVGTMGSISPWGSALGFSDDCLVVHDQIDGIYRSCDGVDEPAFAPDSSYPVLSPGGRFVAVLDPASETPNGVTLYQMPPALSVVRRFPARADEQTWEAREQPLAITPSGSRIFLGALPQNQACYFGPLFDVHVRDVASGSLVDALPPGLQAVDANAQTLAYGGGQIWRAR